MYDRMGLDFEIKRFLFADCQDRDTFHKNEASE
jgi:hypothetical protein